MAELPRVSCHTVESDGASDRADTEHPAAESVPEGDVAPGPSALSSARPQSQRAPKKATLHPIPSIAFRQPTNDMDGGEGPAIPSPRILSAKKSIKRGIKSMRRTKTALQGATSFFGRAGTRSPLSLSQSPAGSASRSSSPRDEYLEQRFAALRDERQHHRIRTELGEACAELRGLAGTMSKTKNFELRQDALTNWSAQLLERVGVIESHAKTLLLPQASSPAPSDRRASRGRESPDDARSSIAAASALPPPVDKCFHVPVATALYLALEAIAQQLRAERAALFLHVARSDELQAICLVNCGSLRPGGVRTGSLTGWAGQVFATGVGVNVSNAYAHQTNADLARIDKQTGSRTRTVLCFPIAGVDSRQRVGVVQLMNKNKGTASFTSEDEYALAAHTGVLAHLMGHYPADLLNNYYDPSHLHRVVPYVAAEPQLVTLPSTCTRETPQLVFRTSISGAVAAKARSKEATEALMRAEGQPLAEQVSLLEVDCYLGRLEECWRRSVLLNMEYEREAAEAAFRDKSLREQLRLTREASARQRAELTAAEAELAELRARLPQHTPVHESGSFVSVTGAAARSAAPHKAFERQATVTTQGILRMPPAAELAPGSLPVLQQAQGAPAQSPLHAPQQQQQQQGRPPLPPLPPSGPRHGGLGGLRRPGERPPPPSVGPLRGRVKEPAAAHRRQADRGGARHVREMAVDRLRGNAPPPKLDNHG
eukprot:TRINITY_DN3842_c0_g1_i1.p1 TRINITY_DN3842_c0_g1~~TRINITY_DN3842_c0_g1_i1.p1  ORF type:complete len:714 (+),score=155.76 TRINITY_DN3842_c0_g1_i1:107-2248(+)